jgi:hypothetical protein
MNTYSPYSSVVEQFTYPSTPDAGTASVTVYYDLGDSVVAATAPTLVSGSTYSITINDDLLGAAGIYRLKWSCKIASSSFYSYTEFRVEDAYVTSSDFFSEFSDFDVPEFTNKFANTEKLARRIIDTYTGQDFQFIKNKTYKYDGNDRSKMNLGQRLNSFSSVYIDESDYTDKVEVDFRSKYFLKLLQQYPYPDSRRDDLQPAIFSKNTVVYVTGDWGWISVPAQITQAAKLLIVDLFDDTRREHFRYGISKIEQGNNRLEFDKGIYNSTGNIDVDILLMDYVYWTMDYVY